MKVLLASDLNPESVNGVIVSVLLLKEELERLGAEVKLLTLSSSFKSYVEGDVTYISSVPLNIYPDVRASADRFSRYIDALIDWHPDIIHSQCEFFTYSFVQRIARHCHAPIVHTYHTQYEYYTQYVLPGNWEKLLAKAMQLRLETADVVIAPTNKTRNYLLREHIGRDIRVIPTGIDLRAFRTAPNPQKLALMREHLRIPEDARVYGSVGRIAREKNLDEVLRAHQMVLKAHPESILLLVGDGAAMEEVRQQAKDLGIWDQTRFTGMVPKKDVGDYYRLMEFFISASVSETQGLTYIEALANARPVVARRDAAIDAVVVPDEDGFQFDTTEEAAADIVRLLDDDALIARLSDGAVQAVNRFDRQIFGESVYALYDEILRRDALPAVHETALARRVARHLKEQAAASDAGKLHTTLQSQWRRLSLERDRKSHSEQKRRTKGKRKPLRGKRAHEG
ncbi:MAG: glycosyltransferase [Peptoniphilaceae bacterium]|nr:glycosyltransferase [Peptoniphilaceae bacterium]MDY6085716.1 glycosyltransferase [Peptoniphilaceae bacterium]